MRQEGPQGGNYVSTVFFFEVTVVLCSYRSTYYSLKEATLSLGLLSSEEFDQLVRPERKF
jgi:hypothetical protein